ncbi:unnamed protein product [Nippostrongylus brasiliensis]|uniref:Armadillo repeat-containing protein 8 n=1 Tax=Nippostrongylus brasiliensis TaxID=27835 RepID=A0A0N4XJF9_NIPBR|nr:unnamed protein product [Nippostrongylus brasiliensis]
MLLKMDFVRIVSSHEHFVILNLPFGPPHSIPSSTSSSSIGLSCGTGSSTLQLQPLSPESISITSRAICLIHNLLSAHEADSRLTDPSIRARIASLYLPLVTIVLDVAGQIYDPFANSSGVSSRLSKQDKNGTALSPSVNPKIALAIAGIGTGPSPPRTPTELNNNRPEKGKATLSLQLSRQLLACFCWVLKNVESSALRHWVRELPPARLSQLLNILQLCVSCFEYKAQQLFLFDKTGGQQQGLCRDLDRCDHNTSR